MKKKKEFTIEIQNLKEKLHGKTINLDEFLDIEKKNINWAMTSMKLQNKSVLNKMKL